MYLGSITDASERCPSRKIVNIRDWWETFIVFLVDNLILACNFKSCKETYSLPQAIFSQKVSVFFKKFDFVIRWTRRTLDVVITMETRVFLKYFVRGCLWEQFFASNFPHAPSNLICLTIFLTLRSLIQF